jgi:hypothetical protein
MCVCGFLFRFRKTKSGKEKIITIKCGNGRQQQKVGGVSAFSGKKEKWESLLGYIVVVAVVYIIVMHITTNLHLW